MKHVDTHVHKYICGNTSSILQQVKSRQQDSVKEIQPTEDNREINTTDFTADRESIFFSTISLYFIHQSPFYVFHFLLVYISLFGHSYMNSRATPVKSLPEVSKKKVSSKN